MHHVPHVSSRKSVAALYQDIKCELAKECCSVLQCCVKILVPTLGSAKIRPAYRQKRLVYKQMRPVYMQPDVRDRMRSGACTEFSFCPSCEFAYTQVSFACIQVPFACIQVSFTFTQILPAFCPSCEVVTDGETKKERDCSE